MNKPLLPLFALALTSTLAGCTEPASPGAQAALTLSNSVQLSAAGKATTPEKITPVRITFPDSRSYSAVPPAFHPKTCQLSSSHFTAEVKIPGEVNLPSYGTKTPPMRVRCTSEQFEFDETIKPVNLTQQAYSAAAAAHVLVGYGLVGAAVTASQASQRDKSQDIYGYPLKIELQ